MPEGPVLDRQHGGQDRRAHQPEQRLHVETEQACQGQRAGEPVEPGDVAAGPFELGLNQVQADRRQEEGQHLDHCEFVGRRGRQDIGADGGGGHQEDQQVDDAEEPVCERAAAFAQHEAAGGEAHQHGDERAQDGAVDQVVHRRGPTGSRASRMGCLSADLASFVRIGLSRSRTCVLSGSRGGRSA
ncbi:MAG: hypothetical protein BWY87_01169 [Deltaproteobacteria bacterium ADurb.Bin510]|nr:MAG: hypothetical protein BWY87_01169 [Deltaproteobacteria bacterium ADurb.Bin510]